MSNEKTNGHAPTQTNSAERVYAEALIEMAQEAGKLAEVAQEIDDLKGLVSTVPDAMRLFSSRVLSTDERAKSLERVFKGKVSDLLYRFIQVVNHKDRLGDLPGLRLLGPAGRLLLLRALRPRRLRGVRQLLRGVRRHVLPLVPGAR